MNRELAAADRQIVSDLYLSRAGKDFVVELVERFGSRFGGSQQERDAAAFIRDRFECDGADTAWLDEFECPGWTRETTSLTLTSPSAAELDVIALPFCPPGEVEAPLVYLGDGHPQAYQDNRERIRGAVVMVTTATPRFYHRTMHRGEKLGRALEAGAAGFIWMRGEPGGLPETGSARFGMYCEVPAVSVSYETGHRMLRQGRGGDLAVRIHSSNRNHRVKSLNPIGQLTGVRWPEEIIVVGAHYDGHDISESAADDGAGTAVVVEALRALAPHRELLGRSVRFVGFAQEEMGLMGAEHYASTRSDENTRFMLNLDGAGRGQQATLLLQGWPERAAFFTDLMQELHEEELVVGDRLGLYSDMYPFAARGIPAATMASGAPADSGAPRGYGHTYWDSLDKVPTKPIQLDAARVARMILRLAAMEELPLSPKSPAEMGQIITGLGYDEVLRYERRSVPGQGS